MDSEIKLLLQKLKQKKITNTQLYSLFIFKNKKKLTKLKVLFYSSTWQDFLYKNLKNIKAYLNFSPENLKSYCQRVDQIKDKLLKDNLHADEKLVRQQLRHLKNQEMMNIFFNDVLGIDNFDSTVRKISYLAETCISIAFYFYQLHQELNIIAMGKLGGHELNYSSDIDLFFISHENLQTPASLIIKKIQKFINILHNLNEDGFVFKVDLAIRPEGHSGCLYSSLTNTKKYFLQRAKEWEFQALIKSRFLLGQEEIKKKFEELKKKLIFQEKNLKAKKYLENIRRMKLRIEENLKGKINFQLEKGFNLKLDSGGIRDIEFFIQFLQLQHGPFSPSLNTTNSLLALKKLKALKIIDEIEAFTLEKNYIFLRRLEHYLQVESFLAIRNFPTSKLEKNRLVEILNQNPKNHFTIKKLEEKLNQVVQENQNIFSCLFHLTLNFFSKIEKLVDQIGDQEEQINQLTNFESDYFINFSESTILNHLNLLSTLNLNSNRTAIVELRKKNSYYYFDIITYDVLEAFPVICGLMASFGLNIISGISYLYTPIKKKVLNWKQNRLFFNNIRTIKNYNYPHPVKDFKNQKIICNLECKFISSHFEKKFKIKKLEKDLNEYFIMLKNQKSQTVLGKLFLTTMQLNPYPKPKNYFKPIFINVDNNIHPFYTMINIRGEDTFLFLFQFTKSFIFQDIYIVRVKIKTLKNEIMNSFYLTNYHGEKIVQEEKIEQLKNFLHLIMYFSFYLFQAPNPHLALKQFTQLAKLINTFREDYSQLKKNLWNNRKTFSQLAKVLGTHDNVLEDFFSLNYDGFNSLDFNSKEFKLGVKTNFEKKFKKSQKELKNLSEKEQLNRFKDNTLFSIDMIFLENKGKKKIEEFCFFLSSLADFIIKKAFSIAWKKTKKNPTFSSLKKINYALLGLGKWGGQELGYASDIEILFIYQERKNGNLEMANSFSNQLLKEIKNIIKVKKDGIFELDFNLRPEGSSSTNLAISFEKFKNYYSFTSEHFNTAINFERMSLAKARVITDNNKKLIKSIITSLNEFVYHPTMFDFVEMGKLREKQISTWSSLNQINVKYSPGGLVEIEYLITCFNITYGRTNLQVRQTNTLKNIEALYKNKYLKEKNYLTLKKSYNFLRNVINALRSVRGNVKDLILPEKNTLEMEYLSRRLKYFNIITKPTDLFSEIVKTMEKVHSLFGKLISQLKKT